MKTQESRVGCAARFVVGLRLGAGEGSLLHGQQLFTRSGCDVNNALCGRLFRHRTGLNSGHSTEGTGTLSTSAG